MSGRRAVVAAMLLFTVSLHGEPARPKIGLALGGGGARGCAHIGVLRVLEEMHIPIDYLAGTSMGAVVGGLYASGMTPDEIEYALTTTNWRDAMTDRTRYKDLSFRRKEDEGRYLTAFDAGLKGGRFVLPSGLRSGQKLRFIIQSQLIPVASVRDFRKLPTPFNAVAADIETGDAVVLDHGDLAEAIRASMSIPGVFSPVEIDGKVLVDGGVAMNVPVDVVRAMGADIVIAIDVGTPLAKRDQLGSLLAITGQVLTILTQKNVREQIAKADLVLNPPVSSVGTMDFEAGAKAAAIGAEYTRAERARLAHLAVDDEQYARFVAARPLRDTSNRPLDYLAVEGSRRVDNRIIRAHVSTRPGKPLNGEVLRRDVTKLFGLDDFQTITFALRDDEGQRGLVLNLKDKPWGPTYVRFGINLSDDLRGDSTYSFLASVTRTRLNKLGAEWRNDFRVGRDFGVLSEFYQPLDYRGRFFVAPAIQYLRNTFSLFENRRRTALFNVAQFGGVFDVGAQFEDWGALRAGVYRARVYAGVNAGAIDLPQGTINVAGLRSSFTLVRTDSPAIPHDGGVILIQYQSARKQLGGLDAYSMLSGNGYFAVTRGKQTLIAGAGGGSSLGTDLPVYDEFSLGGLLNLSAFQTNELHGNRFALIRLGTYRRVRTLSSDIGDGVYAGILAEAGNAWLADESASIDSIHKSVTLILGADTILGPIFLGYARAETSDSRFYVTIGKTF